MGNQILKHTTPGGAIKWVEMAGDDSGRPLVTTEVRAIALLSLALAPGAGASQPCRQGATFHATGQTTAGAGQAVIDIEVSNDGVNWLPHDTILLTLSTVMGQAGIEMDASWLQVRGNLRSISGTGAAVSLTMGA